MDHQEKRLWRSLTRVFCASNVITWVSSIRWAVARRVLVSPWISSSTYPVNQWCSSNPLRNSWYDIARGSAFHPCTAAIVAACHTFYRRFSPVFASYSLIGSFRSYVFSAVLILLLCLSKIGELFVTLSQNFGIYSTPSCSTCMCLLTGVRVRFSRFRFDGVQ